MIIESPLNKFTKIRHGFFTRQGGESSGVYDSLNCGYNSGDDKFKVKANRTIVMQKFCLKLEDLITVQQIHSAKVVIANGRWTLGERPRADGIVTNQVGLAIGVLTADCAPILFVDISAGVVGVSHAGWRGALGGVAEACVVAMETLGANRLRIEAAIGPCIHQKSYEVDSEFKKRFINDDSQNRKFFLSSEKYEHFLFDLPRYILHRLNKMNLQEIYLIPIDTYEDEKRFFSYRRMTHRGESNYGRGISTIVLKV